MQTWLERLKARMAFLVDFFKTTSNEEIDMQEFFDQLKQMENRTEEDLEKEISNLKEL